MKRKMLGFSSGLIALLILTGSITACQSSTDTSQSSTGTSASQSASGESNNEELPLLEITVDIGFSSPATTLENPNDVVTPYVEKLFNIKITEVTQNATQQIPFKERLGAMAAAGNLPDVIIGSTENVGFATRSGKYGDIEEQINNMKHLPKYMDEKFWPRFMTDGKKTQIPFASVNVTEEKYTSDPYNIPYGAWCLWAREDILTAAGYEFTPMAQIQAEYGDKGEVPPASAFEISPKIDTPEKFTEFLQKVKDLNLMVNDKPMIPFSGVAWNQFHIGSMFDFGHWRIDKTGNVDGFLGTPGAKNYYKWLNNAYVNELIDAEFISQKDDQLQQKVAAGRVAAGMYVPDMKSAETALLDVNPEAAIHYIPWPKEDPDLGLYDLYENGFWRMTIRSDFEEKDRLVEYFDWFYSDEGLDILTWGPEDAGIWKMEDGKKVFIDDQVRDDCLNGETGKKGADYYGLYDWRNTYFPYASKVGICAPHPEGYNPMSYKRSYDPVIEVDLLNKSYFGVAGADFNGHSSYGNGTDEVSKINAWFWTKWETEVCAGVISAGTEEQFDQAFDAAYAQFLEETGYDQAKGMMVDWFAENASPW